MKLHTCNINLFWQSTEKRRIKKKQKKNYLILKS